MTTERMSIYVTGSFNGFHRYTEAPEDVAYLRDKHRHLFTWKVEIFVNPTIDRHLEFHQVQNEIKRFVADNWISTGAYQTLGSCESMALELSAFVTENIVPTPHTITVSEDNECGSTYYREL